MRIRQLVLVAEQIDQATSELNQLFGLIVSHRDPPNYADLGIENAVMPAGDTFLEVVAPLNENAPAARYMRSAGGEGGYMVIIHYADLEQAADRVSRGGGRFVYKEEHPDHRQWHIHPSDIGAAIVAIDTPAISTEWRWAGPDWKSYARQSRIAGFTGVEISAQDPRSLARRWQDLLGGTLVSSPGTDALIMDRSEIRFVRSPATVARITGIDTSVSDLDGVLAAARSLNLPINDHKIKHRGVTYSLTRSD